MIQRIAVAIAILFGMSGYSFGNQDYIRIPYNGQTVEIKVRYMFPVTVLFDEPIQQVIWDPGVADFRYEPKVGEIKRNDITFFATRENPGSVGIKIITGDKKDRLKNYSIVLSGANYAVPRTVEIHDKRKWGETSNTAKGMTDLMMPQDIDMYNMLIAHVFNDGIENYSVEYINKTIKRLGSREIILESVIKENVYMQIDSETREEIGIYSMKIVFCNYSKNMADLITIELIKDMFTSDDKPSWEKISYEYDTIPPQQCMDVYVIAKRGKFYEQFIQ